MKHWHTHSPPEVAKHFGVDPEQGLSAEQVTTQLVAHGKNEYTQETQESIPRMVLAQFKDVANIILLLAGFLSLALAIREGHGYLEPVVIFAIIVMNIALAVSQERSAEKALAALKNLNSPRTYVLRDGSRTEINTAEVVPGDILILKAGDLIAADARLLRITDLSVDESSLTGESIASEKNTAPIEDPETPIGDQNNMVFSGSLVAAGNGEAVVVSTGMDTEMGKIASYLGNTKKELTPLQQRLNKISRVISIVAILAAIVLLVDGIIRGNDFWQMMLAAVSLAVAAVPETLQLIVTLTLTHGVKKMVTQQALIRKLPAVETLGNTSVICSDKTGTLTQNQMAIKRLWLPDHEPVTDTDDFNNNYLDFVKWLALASNASLEKNKTGEATVVGDATESAIIRLLDDKGMNKGKLLKEWPKVGEVPFSSDRKMMTSIHCGDESHYIVLSKGAFDRLPCSADPEEIKAQRREMHDAFTDDALRVIALAGKKVNHLPEGEELEHLEDELSFIGLIGLIDPPREEAAQAIATAKDAGIKTVMITGDHAGTAAAIAKDLGILDDHGQVVTGRELAQMSDDKLKAHVRDFSVYARVSPEDKIRIVNAWQEENEVVVMTGDGVNDAPALTAADVGVAMGQAGTEVAKSAAEMILTDDNFATIVAAVKEGRSVFDNVKKTIYFLLVCNLSEIVIMLTAALLGWGIALTPVMLLLINVLGDGIPGLSLAKESASDTVMSRKPIARNESFFADGLLSLILQQTIVSSLVGLIAFYFGHYVPMIGGVEPSLEAGQTMTFLVVALTSIVHIFNVHSPSSAFKASYRDNPSLVYSAIIMIVIFVLMVLLPPAAAILGFVTLGVRDWLIVLGLSIVPFIFAEISKLIRNRIV